MKPHEVYFIMNNTVSTEGMTDTETLIVASFYALTILILIIIFIYLWLQDRI